MPKQPLCEFCGSPRSEVRDNGKYLCDSCNHEAEERAALITETPPRIANKLFNDMLIEEPEKKRKRKCRKKKRK